jgi:hypothetical protein
MSKLVGAALVAIAFSAHAATAFFTGQMNMVQSVTGQMVWNCQYQYAGHTFWRAYAGNCPSQVEVQ